MRLCKPGVLCDRRRGYGGINVLKGSSRGGTNMGMMKHTDVIDRLLMRFKGRYMRVYMSMSQYYEGVLLGRKGTHLVFLNMGAHYFVCHIPFEDIKCFSMVQPEDRA